MDERLLEQEQREAGRVDTLGRDIGYGRLMQLAEECWRRFNVQQHGKGGAEHTTGPCASMMVKCACLETGMLPHECSWCCGAGRVTKRVHDAATGNRQAEVRMQELERRAAPLNELDVRHIVATEMARVMLSQVLIGENSQVVAQAQQWKERASKLDAECAELHQQVKDALHTRDTWKADAQRWAGDFLTLARLLGVPEAVRDRTVVAEAYERVRQTLASSHTASLDVAEQVVQEALSGFDGVKVAISNLREVIARRFSEMRSGGAT